MKHPAFRINDILRMDREWLDLVVNYVKPVLDMIPFEIPVYDEQGEWQTYTREAGDLKLEIVGSYTRGIAGIFSDMDFNIAFKTKKGLPDWDRQMAWKRWMHTKPNSLMEKIIRYLHSFTQKYGLKLDVACVDPKSWSYNTHVDVETMKLYHRGNYLDNFIPNVCCPERVSIDQNSIDLNNIKEVPPCQKERLIFDGMCGAWKAMPFYVSNKGYGGASKDEWADLVPEWRNKYGEYYVSYHTLNEGDGVLAPHIADINNPDICKICNEPMPKQ